VAFGEVDDGGSGCGGGPGGFGEGAAVHSLVIGYLLLVIGYWLFASGSGGAG
jgi:hypothetical protein